MVFVGVLACSRTWHIKRTKLGVKPEKFQAPDQRPLESLMIWHLSKCPKWRSKATNASCFSQAIQRAQEHQNRSSYEEMTTKTRNSSRSPDWKMAFHTTGAAHMASHMSFRQPQKLARTFQNLLRFRPRFSLRDPWRPRLVLDMDLDPLEPLDEGEEATSMEETRGGVLYEELQP